MIELINAIWPFVSVPLLALAVYALGREIIKVFTNPCIRVAKICAWCGKVMAYALDDKKGDYGVSHGICDDCKKIVAIQINASTVKEGTE